MVHYVFNSKGTHRKVLLEKKLQLVENAKGCKLQQNVKLQSVKGCLTEMQEENKILDIW